MVELRKGKNILIWKPGVQRALEDGIRMGGFKIGLMFRDLHLINVAKVGCCGHEIEQIILTCSMVQSPS